MSKSQVLLFNSRYKHEEINCGNIKLCRADIHSGYEQVLNIPELKWSQIRQMADRHDATEINNARSKQKSIVSCVRFPLLSRNRIKSDLCSQISSEDG